MRALIFLSLFTTACLALTPDPLQADGLHQGIHAPSLKVHHGLVNSDSHLHDAAHARRQPDNGTDSVNGIPKPKLLANATQSDIDAARAIVNATLAKTKVANAQRLANPLRNQYTLTPGTVTGGGGSGRRAADGDDSQNPNTPELVPITQEMADAAALIA